MERRKYSGVEVSCPTLLFSEINRTPKVCSTINLSLGGARTETPFYLIPGESVEMSILLNSHVVRCRGQVMDVLCLDGDRPTARIRFQEISKEDRRYLRRYIYQKVKSRGKWGKCSIQDGHPEPGSWDI